MQRNIDELKSNPLILRIWSSLRLSARTTHAIYELKLSKQTLKITNVKINISN